MDRMARLIGLSRVRADVRIKIPGQVNPGPSSAPNPRFTNFVPVGINGPPSSSKLPNTRKRTGEIENKDSGGESGMGELAAAIHTLGEGFMRIEKVKMDMARQVEEMRMEMEMKRTEMILESEQRILEAFAKAIAERGSKRAKNNSPEN
ncbi:Alcohol dehydrogenase transcription factor Myb/SANT-like family protein [Striga hermonthica]|uniref:Alcohol dehydrogenase transcription factor Myb/SANT-like family protein n=1 Tax=Striga hermonthica TaxID=68872 RepID=A0A9N7RS73_STRHE|nr:Alcohol dehydrogenase transcription factor Myb/SANT-like family protein [Striga hermonthica]